MPLLKNIALVNQSRRITSAEFSQVSAALQKQLSRDLYPVWNIQATVDAFERIQDVPLGYWPVLVSENIGRPGSFGFHHTSRNQPYAMVQANSLWPLSASHEILEMLVDPAGNSLHASDCIDPSQGRVQYLVEVSDPCGAAEFGCYVNGYLLSDFYTPEYFDPVPVSTGRYSCYGRLTAPRQVLRNGYITWYNSQTSQWYQYWVNASGRASQRVLSGIENMYGSIRNRIDALSEYKGHTAYLKNEKILKKNRSQKEIMKKAALKNSKNFK